MAPKRKKMPVLEEGDEIVVTPKKTPVDQSATAEAAPATTPAPSATTTTSDDEKQQTRANDSSDNSWTNQEKLELLKVRENYFFFNRDQQAAQLHNQMSRLRRQNGEPERPKRSGYEITSMTRELAHDGITIEELEAAINPKPAKKKAKRSGG